MTHKCINCSRRRRCVLIEASLPADGVCEDWHDPEVRILLCRACLRGEGDIYKFVVGATLLDTIAESL